MARIVAVKEYLEKALKDESKPWAKMFALAEEKTGVDRLYVFVGELIAACNWSYQERRDFQSFPLIGRPTLTYDSE